MLKVNPNRSEYDCSNAFRVSIISVVMSAYFNVYYLLFLKLIINEFKGENVS